MRKLLILPQARLDLLQIWIYVSEDSIAAADHVGEILDKAIRDLAFMPGKGHVRPDVKSKTTRFWPVHSFMIAYRYNSETVTIIRVIRGAKNFRGLFR